MAKKLISRHQNGGNVMGYNYVGKVDKKDIPNYQKDISRYGTIPEVVIRPQKYSSSFDKDGFENFVNAATLGGLNNLSPTQWIRRGYDAVTGNLTANNWFNGNNGIVSNKYAQSHPILSAAANMVGDVASLVAAKGATNVFNTLELGKNLNPFDNEYSRRIVYYNRKPWGYDNPLQTVKYITKDYITGKQRDIDETHWEKNFVRRYPTIGKARADAWRMYNRFPQKYNTFIKNVDGTYTAQKDIDAIKMLIDNPEFHKALQQSKLLGKPFNYVARDFVNGAGGDVNSQVKYIDQIMPSSNKSGTITRGIVQNSDVWDLNPFRSEDIIDGIKNLGPVGKLLGNTNVVKNAANKIANFEVGQVFGSKPFKVVNTIPFTVKTTLHQNENGIGFYKNVFKGFDPTQSYPEQELKDYNIKDPTMNPTLYESYDKYYKNGGTLK